jgi:hypothetical protein
MLKWFFIIYFIALSPSLAMNSKDGLAGLGNALVRVMFRRPVAPREKSADEIIAEARAKGQIEFLSCEEWLQKERPQFSEVRFAAHPLFPVLRKAMALADFEVDTLTGFIHRVMMPDMVKEQSETIMPLKQNAGVMKVFVGKLIDCLEGKLSFETFIEEYLRSRLKMLIAYQAEVMGRKEIHVDKSKVKPQKLQGEDNQYTAVKAGVLRSHNTKNAIIRDLLGFLRDQQSKPLVHCLPRRVVDLIVLSSTLHPFLNGENEEWLDYDVALESGEGRDFLGNAALLGVDLQQFFRAEQIQGVEIPNAFKKMTDLPVPAFLRTIPETAAEKEARVELGFSKITAILRTLNPPPPMATPSQAPQPNAGAAVAPGAPATAVTAVTTMAVVAAAVPHPSGGDEATPSATSSPTSSSATLQPNAAASATVSSASTSTAMAPRPNEDAAAGSQAPTTAPETGSQSTASSSSSAMPSPPSVKASAQSKAAEKGEKKAPKASASAAAAAAAGAEEGRTDTHADTIYDIFRPHGYKRLDDARIITAWKHVLQGSGRLKKDTGSSHQPLYADLQDNSHVVMRFFRSSGYGPNYMKYVREAFDAIGFGRAWLIELGYIL